MTRDLSESGLLSLRPEAFTALSVGKQAAV